MSQLDYRFYNARTILKDIMMRRCNANQIMIVDYGQNAAYQMGMF